MDTDKQEHIIKLLANLKTAGFQDWVARPDGAFTPTREDCKIRGIDNSRANKILQKESEGGRCQHWD